MRAVAIFAACVLLAACGSSAKHAENTTTTTMSGTVACTPLGDAEHADQTMNAIDEATLAGGAVLGAVNVPVGGSCDLTVRLTPGPVSRACTRRPRVPT